MPIYVYRCDDCQDTEEILQKSTDAPLQTCPRCGSKAVRKLISNVGIIFKGSGFYKTDNASNSVGTREEHHEEHHKLKDSSEVAAGNSANSTANANSTSSNANDSSHSSGESAGSSTADKASSGTKSSPSESKVA